MFTGIITALFVIIVIWLMNGNARRKVMRRHKNDIKLQISDGMVAFASSTEFTEYNTATYGKLRSISLSDISDIHEAAERELIERFERVRQIYKKTKPVNVQEFMKTNLAAVVTLKRAKQTMWFDFAGDDRRANYQIFRGLASLD